MARLLNGIAFFSVLLVLALQQYHEYSTGQYDPYRCQALLHDGSWSPQVPGIPEQWEPKDCLMVEYSKDDLRNCMDGRKIVLVGDSTLRQIFWALAQRIDRIHARHEMMDLHKSLRGMHRNLHFKDGGVEAEFVWDPWLNSTALNNTLKAFRTSPTLLDEVAVKHKDEPSTALIVLGAPGLWAARYGDDDYMDIFKRGVTGVLPYLSSNLNDDISLSSMSRVYGANGTANQILLTPVHIPKYGSLFLNRSKTITPQRIEDMNDYLSGISFNQSSHILWAFNRMATEPEQSSSEDGIHVSNAMAAEKVDIILNAHCNTAARARSRSFRGTCCVADSPNFLYKWGFLLWSLTATNIPRQVYLRMVNHLPIHRVEIFKASRIILFVLIWCWFCDGTSRVAKVERHYHQNNFIVICLAWLVTSISTFRKSHQATDELSTSADGAKRDPPGYRGPGYLSRDHSDEIKGLMQGFILLYHYHHASQTLWVYKIIRIFISAYFYLSGYGHTLYLLKTNDFSFRRIMVVLFRLNFLSALLPYMMGTTYSLYYFSSAISFWYLVLYGMLGFYRSYNYFPRRLLMKIIATAVLTDIFISIPGILEVFAKILYAIFRMSWDVEELRFRLRLDRYIVFIGAAVAAFVHNESVCRARTILPLGHVPSAPSPLAPRLTFMFHSICAIIFVFFFSAIQFTLNSKIGYNRIHPFISWIPILAFVALRNSCQEVRQVHMVLPAALGRVALETYVLQYHVWLGADATARLSLRLWDGNLGRNFEMVLFTAAFVVLAVLAHSATDMLARWVSGRGVLVLCLGLWMGNLVSGW